MKFRNSSKLASSIAALVAAAVLTSLVPAQAEDAPLAKADRDHIAHALVIPDGVGHHTDHRRCLGDA